MRSDLEIGERISRLRVERGWSITHLANLVGTNVKTIKDWESGVSMPSVPNVRKRCEVFSTTSDYLLNLDRTPSICLLGLSEKDIRRARSIVQALIDTSDD